eukprot:TRINITY_DN18805_c2_g2_i4.p1 TRINITY_DN18805_c2_g2~~TRINITY_DN18805_c2_g2_i4.p1  ORF type:complete len:309 (+),score=44.28 TRINITY_DN18805_c2_g2_i4:77-1003(+)
MKIIFTSGTTGLNSNLSDFCTTADTLIGEDVDRAAEVGQAAVATALWLSYGQPLSRCHQWGDYYAEESEVDVRLVPSVEVRTYCLPAQAGDRAVPLPIPTTQRTLLGRRDGSPMHPFTVERALGGSAADYTLLLGPGVHGDAGTPHEPATDRSLSFMVDCIVRWPHADYRDPVCEWARLRKTTELRSGPVVPALIIVARSRLSHCGAPLDDDSVTLADAGIGAEAVVDFEGGFRLDEEAASEAEGALLPIYVRYREDTLCVEVPSGATVGDLRQAAMRAIALTREPAGPAGGAAAAAGAPSGAADAAQ